MDFFGRFRKKLQTSVIRKKNTAASVDFRIRSMGSGSGGMRSGTMRGSRTSTRRACLCVTTATQCSLIRIEPLSMVFDTSVKNTAGTKEWCQAVVEDSR